MKLWNKVLALALCTALLFALLQAEKHVYAVDAFAVSMGTAQANPGGEVTVDLVLANNPGFQVLGVGFSYNEEYLTLVGIENKVESLNMTVDQSVIWDGAANYSEDGVLATLTFRVAEDAPLDEYEIEVILLDACNDAFEMLEVSVKAGSIGVVCAHNDLKMVEAVAADCENMGNYRYYVCNGCGAILDADKNVTTLDAQTIPALGHSWKDATCTEAKTCMVCGDTEGEANGHTAGTAVTENGTDAACTAAGSYDTVVYCTVCGEELSRETTEVPATGHTEGKAVVENEVDATCTEFGSYDTVIYCTVCGEEISRVTTLADANGHTVGAAVIENEVEPTYEQEGSYDTVVYCAVCEEELERKTTVIPAKILWGDANKDKKVDANDATWIAKYYVGIITENDIDLLRADVSGDGVVNHVDAMLIAQYCCGDIMVFPVESATAG